MSIRVLLRHFQKKKLKKFLRCCIVKAVPTWIVPDFPEIFLRSVISWLIGLYFFKVESLYYSFIGVYLHLQTLDFTLLIAKCTVFIAGLSLLQDSRHRYQKCCKSRSMQSSFDGEKASAEGFHLWLGCRLHWNYCSLSAKQVNFSTTVTWLSS